MQNLQDRICAVCGDTPAKIHYGVLGCFGCKGFFRRAVKDGRNKYVCRFDKNCVVNKCERNACRYCRFRKCLLVGMNPDYVRPDREKGKKGKTLLSKKKSLSRSISNRLIDPSDWTSLLSPSSRKLLTELGRLDVETQQTCNGSFEGISNFNLKSLIADRSLARKNAINECCNGAPTSSDHFLSIERIVQLVDYTDRFLNLLEEEHHRKFSVEDKSALISNTMIHLMLFETIVKFIAKGACGVEDLKQTIGQLPICSSSINQKLSDVFEIILRKTPSIMEYSVVKAFIVTSAESTLLSNSLNDSLCLARDNLSELLFKVIKHSRGKTSVNSANNMSNLLHFVYESRTLSTTILNCLQPSYQRDDDTKIPFQKIFTDIINPEVSDLLITTANCRKSSMQPPSNSHQLPPIPSDNQLFHFSPPSLSPHISNSMLQQSQQSSQLVYNPQMDYQNQMPSTSDMTLLKSSQSSSSPSSSSLSTFQMYNVPQSSSSSDFAAPSNIYRPNNLSFPKLPLQMTKSMEEILRPPGMIEDHNILNKPLAKDWADGFRLTPVFNKDIVSQFFPELSNPF